MTNQGSGKGPISISDAVNHEWKELMRLAFSGPLFVETFAHLPRNRFRTTQLSFIGSVVGLGAQRGTQRSLNSL